MRRSIFPSNIARMENIAVDVVVVVDVGAAASRQIS